MVGSSDLLSSFDVDAIAPEALLFQTGYLTIHRTERRGSRTYYRLGYPNLEVRQSLNESLLNHLTGDASRRAAHSAQLYDLLEANDFAGLETLFHAFFASIPYEWYTSNDIAHYEGYYASVLLLLFRGAGAGRHSRRQQQPRPLGYGGSIQWERVSLRVQGGRDDAEGRGHGAIEGTSVCRQVPRPRPADLPDRRGVQQGRAQCRGV